NLQLKQGTIQCFTRLEEILRRVRMDKNRLYIEMPDESEVKAEIDAILAKGLQPKESFYARLKNIYKEVGLRHLFHDAVELMFIILIVLSILIFSVMSVGEY